MNPRLLLVFLVACTTSDVLPPVRFANAPAVTVVNDRRDVAAQPATRTHYPWLYNYNGAIQRRISRALEVPRPQRALGVNALDEVPDSTWFTNRIGVRDLRDDEIRNGPLSNDSPELHRPWTVKSSKVGGASLGFVMTDARGIKYLLKFDDLGSPELETGIDVLVNRLVWAAGFNVPEDQIVYFHDDDLVLSKDSVIKDSDGKVTGKLDRAELERRLATIDHGLDGRIRGLVSRWIEGKPVGGFPGEGVRHDDPNDVIPHELRRDLRGAYSLFAWVDHVDIHGGNFVDSWVTDPADPHRHYLRHYFIDFGRSLGAMAYLQLDRRRGHVYLLDVFSIARTLVTLGIVERDWEPRLTVPGVGMFDAKTFDPGAWHPDWPTYLPLVTADRIDKFWGAKLVGRFTRAQIAAAVAAARFHDPAVATYIVDTLVARQRLTTNYWFARVNPLDHFEASDAGAQVELCFVDLAIANHLVSETSTAQRLETYDWHTRPVATTIATPSANGRSCARIDAAPSSDDGGYTIVRVLTNRPGFSGETQVHLGRDPSTGAVRVIGIWRP
jgi:hypothetical protein